MTDYNADVDRLIDSQRRHRLLWRALTAALFAAALTASMWLMGAGRACDVRPPLIEERVTGSDSVRSSPPAGPLCEAPQALDVQPPQPVVATGEDDEVVYRLVELILGVVCGERVECRDERVWGVWQGVSELLAACRDEDVPESWCLALMVTATAESGFRAHPGCGVTEECAAGCDEEVRAAERQACLMRCAAMEGASVERARRCNDRGTSRGPFQMKPWAVARCMALGSPHDFYAAGRCYLQMVAESQKVATAVCGVRGAHTWAVAWKRVGAGPYHGPDRLPQCRESRYARLALQWLVALRGG